MIVVHAHFDVSEESIDKFLTVVKQAQTPSTSEAGNISYRIYQSPETPTQFVMGEAWESEDALRAHMQSEHMATVNAELPACLTGRPSVEIFAGATPLSMRELMADAE